MRYFKQVLITAIALLSIGGISYGWISMNHKNHMLRTQLEQSTKQVDQQDHEKKAGSQRTQTQFQGTASHNSDPKISSVANQNYRIQQAGSAINKFFQTYYTFNDSSDYDARSNRLLKQGIITDQLSHNSQVFQNDKMASGTNYIDVMELNALFDNAYVFAPQINTHDHTVELMAQVAYDSGYNNQQSATNDMIYRIGYDFDSHKITSVKAESSLFRNSNILYNLHTNGMLNDY